jgi:hypothetical protein
MINYEDVYGRDDRDSLLDWACEEAHDEGFPLDHPWFFNTVDPYGDFSDRYRASTIPSNLVVDDDMVIRYKVGDYAPSSLRSIINQLLGE